MKSSLFLVILAMLGLCHCVFIDLNKTPTNGTKSSVITRNITITGLIPLTLPVIDANNSNSRALAHLSYLSAKAMQDINNDPRLLNGTHLTINAVNSQLLSPVLLGQALRQRTAGSVAFVGGLFELDGSPLSVISNVLQVASVATLSSDSALSDKSKFPMFVRFRPASEQQSNAIFDLFDFFYSRTRQLQWRQIGVVSTATPYGITLSNAFLNTAETRNFYITSYQQFLGVTSDNTNLAVRDITQQVTQLKESKARVFVSLMQTSDMQFLIENAIQYGMFAPDYVWLCADACATNILHLNFSFIPDKAVIVKEYFNAIPGFLGVASSAGYGTPSFTALVDAYQKQFNSTQRLGVYPAPLYDAYYAVAIALDSILKENPNAVINPLELAQAIRNVTFRGITGPIEFTEDGDRFPIYNIVNVWRGSQCPECLGADYGDVFIPVGTWTANDGLQMDHPVRFFDGTTRIPDLNLHQSFDYFDCTDGKKKTDETGKTVNLDKPSWGAKQIDADYYCDEYLDCDDMSDEPYDCVPSFKVLFIIYGIITGLLILFTIFVFVPFTLIFGFIIPRKRVRASSPLFLLIIIISGVFGIGSTYAWYGKPHSVACGFQPWLLGLAIVSMNSALIAKTFRIWRVFRSPFKVKVISNVELMVLWIILVAPVILILFLWTLVSTPTAKLEEHEGLEHLVCAGGGFTDSNAAGYAWFFILVGYQGLVMLLGILLTFAIRNVPSKFNEGKLIALSIYNITLLGAIVIPVFLVLRYIIPFVAWIIRTSVIIYVFTATLALQFIPKIWGVVLSDKFKDPRNQDGLEPRTDPEMTI
eukprot:TRINITY_DN477_c2_g3_i4.p1 TRINITY_DN477_c2_g3~~TRINITY_DN477_c2_g3_i4.p1  ORF type:complete len:816 (-),score=294.24 TRINITY_DN477_c2_g3_i4:361-2808(-)